MDQAKHFAEIAMFLEVAKQLSFVRAAERLQVETGSLSRAIANLEKRLGTRLLQRTTRVVSLTEVGLIYAQKCEQIMAAFDEAGDAVAQLHQKPRGLLRVSVPMTLGQLHISPLISEFLYECPDVRMELELSDEIVDLVARNIDVAIRIGSPSDSLLVTRKVAQSKRVLCASTEYLHRAGRPLHPADLRDHNCLIFSPRSSDHVWTFTRKNDSVKVPVSGTLKANNSVALLNAALGGTGIASIATHVVGDHLRNGQLELILPDWEQQSITIYAVYPSNRYVPLKVRVFVDFIINRLEKYSQMWSAAM